MDRSENMDSEKDVDLSRLPLSERSRIERKNSSGKKNVLFFLLGMLVGIVGIFAIGHPFAKDSYEVSEYKKVVAQNDTLKKENESLTKKQEESEKKLDEDKKIIDKEGKNLYARDNLIKSAYEFYQNDDQKKAKSLLKDFTKSNFEYSEGKQLFVALGGKNEEKTKGRQANDLFVKGRQQYNWGNYDKALKKLLEADSLDNNDQSILYFIGRCYEQQNNIDEAKYYFEKVALLDNNSDRGILARQRLDVLAAQ